MSNQSNEIARLNDAFRKEIFSQPSGRVLMTRTLTQMFDDHASMRILKTIQNFNDFNKGNDPYGERDFGGFDFEQQRIIWKIDYYDHSMEYGSQNPADPDQTNRVITIMAPQDW